MTHLTALPVAVPFVVAALLIATGPVLPRPLQDFLGISTAAAVVAMCVLLAAHSAHQPFAYCVGGWTPRHGVAISRAATTNGTATGRAVRCVTVWARSVAQRAQVGRADAAEPLVGLHDQREQQSRDGGLDHDVGEHQHLHDRVDEL